MIDFAQANVVDHHGIIRTACWLMSMPRAQTLTGSGRNPARRTHTPARRGTFLRTGSEPAVPKGIPVLHVSGLNNYLFPIRPDCKRQPFRRQRHRCPR